MRGQPCPIVRTWVDLERSIWAGFTCATVDAADTPIQIPAGTESYDYARFTLYVKGVGVGPALLDNSGQRPTGLRTLVSPAMRGARPKVDVLISSDGGTVEFRASESEPAMSALLAWSRENAATIDERFVRLDAEQHERGWVIRVHLTSADDDTPRLSTR